MLQDLHEGPSDSDTAVLAKCR